MAETVVEILEMIDVGHQQRQRLVLGAGIGDGTFERAVEEFAVGELGEGIGQALVAHRLEVLVHLVDFLLGGVEPLFQLLVGDFHLLSGVHQAFDDGAQAFAILIFGLIELLDHVGEAFGVAVGGAGGGVDHRHDLLDLAHHLIADLVDTVGQPGRRQIGRINLFEVRIGEPAGLA